MQYIKNYNEELYNHIVGLHEKKKKNKKTLTSRIKRAFTSSKKLKNIREIDSTHRDKIIGNALKFMGISREEFQKNIEIAEKKLNDIERYENQNQTDVFWEKQVDKIWLSLNIDVQLNRYNDVYSGICEVAKDNMTLCDYGCGSGSTSFAVNEKINFKNIDLYDLDNYPSEFVKYYIKENNLKKAKWYNVLNGIQNNYDMIVCIDVLEHLENSYGILLNFHKHLNKNGILVLRIAFECEDKTHLPQAAENFFIKNDGMKFLNENFKLIKQFPDTGFMVNGIYKKIK